LSWDLFAGSPGSADQRIRRAAAFGMLNRSTALPVSRE